MSNLKSETIYVNINGLKCDTFITRPSDIQSPLPIIVFCMDMFGLRPNLYKIAERIAEHGFFVVLPNIFYRNISEPIVTSLENVDALCGALCAARGVAAKCSIVEFLSDMKSVLEYVSTHYGDVTQKDNVGLLGLCFGGAFAMRLANEYPEIIKSCASVHAGQLVTDTPESPHKLINNIKAVCYFAHADQDQWMTLEDISVLNKALDDANINYESEVYAGCAHGWNIEDFFMFNREGHEKTMAKLFDFYSKTLKKATQ
ncbi:hypothetical protein CYY_006611 [Polysphondylium violaceum]|uniref:Dienelactone hydrolase domain-containing protein n=1 Tax=Polysphondylium violaceum TaxID=133409 RepID=A0A8J4PQQ7_9MYCE|nr:hypothetical protein CYY_006611 [Polysphondylium violaceum]